MRRLHKLLLLLTAGGASAPVEQTLTLQPDGTTGVDTMINGTAGGETLNYATDTGMIIGERSDGVGRVNRGLIRFDLSSIPSGSTIASATLTLTTTFDLSTTARTMRVYRQKRAWVEAQATWNIYSTGNNWQTAGGFGVNDCEQTDIGSASFGATEANGTVKTFALTTAAISEMVNGTFTNNGFLLKMDTEADDAYQVASSDNATAASRPKLVVVYTPPS